MNNKGFVFLETIIVTVVLTTTLIFLYSNFSKTVNDEKRRLYYDDIAYMYKTLFIRQALIKHINKDVFDKAVINANNVKVNGDNELTNSLGENYVFLFNSESKYCMNYDSTNKKCDPNDYKSLFMDNSYISKLHDIYNFKMLMYLNVSDIQNIKNCINGLDTKPDGTLTDKCKNYKLYTSKYSDSNLDEFMLTLNKEDSKRKDDTYAEHILVSLFYEKKDGTAQDTVVKGGFKSCIHQKVKDEYITTLPVGTTLKDALDKYYKQDIISYNMACENAYYLSWVYYD